jgi:hypothetical protein
MALDTINTGAVSGVGADTDASRNLFVNPPGYTSAGVIRGGGDVSSGSVAIVSEIDAGTKNAIREVISPETDKDSRLRIAHDHVVDREHFTYTAQNTGKHTFTFTTLAATITAAGITTNSGSITTTTTGLTFGTHAMFPVGGTQGTVCETSVAFSAQPTANVVFDFGLFQRGATTAFAPLDGVYFRLTSAGMFGVINSNGTEVTTAVFPLSGGTGTFLYVNSNTNRYLIQTNNVSTSFWINNVKYGEIPTPVGLNFPCKSLALPWSFRHAIVGGAAGAVLQAVVSDYKVMIRGPQYADTLGTVGNRIWGSFQGLSGGTMGGLTVYTNSTNPTAAVPSNTALTANLPAGLGGQAWETATLALNIDGILCSYQVPAGSVTVPGRRLKIRAVRLLSFIQTVIAGGPLIRTFCLNFGHTAVSLATAESASMASATTKARRVMLLPELTQVITAAQAVSTMVSQPGGSTSEFEAPIYVNPGEFVSISVKHIGTVGTAGTIATNIQYNYSWE